MLCVDWYVGSCQVVYVKICGCIYVKYFVICRVYGELQVVGIVECVQVYVGLFFYDVVLIVVFKLVISQVKVDIIGIQFFIKIFFYG